MSLRNTVEWAIYHCPSLFIGQNGIVTHAKMAYFVVAWLACPVIMFVCLINKAKLRDQCGYW